MRELGWPRQPHSFGDAEGVARNRGGKGIGRGSDLFGEAASKIILLFPVQSAGGDGSLPSTGNPAVFGGTPNGNVVNCAQGCRQSFTALRGSGIAWLRDDAALVVGPFASSYFQLYKNDIAITDWMPISTRSSQAYFQPLSPFSGPVALTAQLASSQFVPRQPIYVIDFDRIDVLTAFSAAPPILVQAAIFVGQAALL